MRETFDTVMDWVFTHEGGYSIDRNDPGNWTGGKVGKGQLKGTKFGISAKAYPNLDIKSLTKEQARALYKRDYWDKVKGDDLPAGLDYVAYDAAINSGPPQSAKWIQRAVGVDADGLIGAQTLAAIDAAARKNEEALIASATSQRLAFLKSLKTWSRYGNGWKRRVDEVNANSLKLARADTKYVMPTYTAGMERKARAEDTRAMATNDGKAAVGAGLGAIGIAATQAADKLAPYTASAPVLQYIFVALTCVGIGVGAWMAIKGLINKQATA